MEEIIQVFNMYDIATLKRIDQGLAPAAEDAEASLSNDNDPNE
jgi:hypothetical protein